ncbi:MAG: aminodeoxychorismate lyase [Pseudomonadota bacterium]|nr:aminodeoxychorismate lyase [Pseudomonadota bacterium]
MSLLTLCDGLEVDARVAGSRALQYGDGVFRTLLYAQGQLIDWERHVDKLAADCAALQLTMPDPVQLAVDARRAVGSHREAIVKVIVARQAGERGYRSAGTASECWIIASSAPAENSLACRAGIRVAISEVTLAAQPLLAGIKHLNRLEQVLASRDWPADVDERLMCDAQGQLICGTRSNLFCVRGQRLLTPALNHCGVAGIMRGKLIDLAQAQGLDVSIQALRPGDLHRADEVFICNAVIGLWPVCALDVQRWPAPGPLTQRLMQALAHPRVVLDPPMNTQGI